MSGKKIYQIDILMGLILQKANNLAGESNLDISPISAMIEPANLKRNTRN